MSAHPQSACPVHPARLLASARATTPAGAAALLYGLLAYAAFFAAICYAIGFVGNWLVPKSIDSGTPGPLLPSVLINAALLAAFVVQHTVMARPAFKRRWTRIVPEAIERSTFVLAASICLGAAMALWRPLPQVLWEVHHPAAAWDLNALSLLGWATVFGSSFMISHFELFGLKQVWARVRGVPATPAAFRLVGLYRLVRHPLMVGFLIAFWSTPRMSVGHLLFALLTSAYIFFGVWMEERDLVAAHGEDYLAYRRRVRGFVPIPRRIA